MLESCFLSKEKTSQGGVLQRICCQSVSSLSISRMIEIVLIKFANEVKQKISAANMSEKNEDIKLKCSLWPLFMGGEVMGLGSAI